MQAAVRGSTVRRLTKRGREQAREKRELAMQDEPLVKLLDFGIAQMCPVTDGEEGQKGRVDDSVMKSGGTPAFYAPEMMQKGAYHGRPADVWAAGVSLCMMVSGKLPFEADDLPSSECTFACPPTKNTSTPDCPALPSPPEPGSCPWCKHASPSPSWGTAQCSK